MALKPPKLSPGDVVGIAVPASPGRNPEVIDDCAAAVGRLGFIPRLATNVRERHGYLAGSDHGRADDLHELFGDPEVKGIFCVRGGYGSARLLPLIDFELIRSNPKPLVGYSDLTSLQMAICARADLISFHGPTIDASLIAHDVNHEATRRLLAAVCGTGEFESVGVGATVDDSATIVGGRAEGALYGGNLCVLCTLIGTPWMPSLEGGILFIEDVNEAPYKIDRCLTHLLNAGVLDSVAGVALGTFRDCNDPSPLVGKEWRQTLNDVFRDRLAPLGVPVLSGLSFGHVEMNATLPVGIRVQLDADAGELRFLETAVS